MNSGKCGLLNLFICLCILSFGRITMQDIYSFHCYFQIFPQVRRQNNSQVNQKLAICLSCGFGMLNSLLIGKQCSAEQLSWILLCLNLYLYLFEFAAKTTTFTANCLCQNAEYIHIHFYTSHTDSWGISLLRVFSVHLYISLFLQMFYLILSHLLSLQNNILNYPR